MLTDAFTTLAVAGAVDDAIALAERGRAWLPTPHNPPNMTAGPTTVYLATSERETVIVSPALEGPVVLDIDRDDIMVPALSGLDVARSTTAPLRGFVPLLEVVDAITRALPEADALQLVPIGLCAVLPLAAGRTVDGRYLVERSTLSHAPSRTWARASSRARPTGESIGAFHEGPSGFDQLDLVSDRSVIEATLPGAALLSRPTAQDVLGRLGRTCPVAHLSCHGSYAINDPLASALHFATPLTIADVLERRAGPWLVNLSACETGLVDLIRSDDGLPFPTAFLIGGAAHVISTLWSVSDDHASRFNQIFYTRLQEGCSPASAHREALLSMVHLHPYYWAGFIHHGAASYGGA